MDNFFATNGFREVKFIVVKDGENKYIWFVKCLSPRGEYMYIDMDITTSTKAEVKNYYTVKEVKNFMDSALKNNLLANMTSFISGYVVENNNNLYFLTLKNDVPFELLFSQDENYEKITNKSLVFPVFNYSELEKNFKDIVKLTETISVKNSHFMLKRSKKIFSDLRKDLTSILSYVDKCEKMEEKNIDKNIKHIENIKNKILKNKSEDDYEELKNTRVNLTEISLFNTLLEEKIKKVNGLKKMMDLYMANME